MKNILPTPYDRAAIRRTLRFLLRELLRDLRSVLALL